MMSIIITLQLSPATNTVIITYQTYWSVSTQVMWLVSSRSKAQAQVCWYVAHPGECYYNTLLVAMRFHRRVWYRALSQRYACIGSSGIILTPEATFVPNFFSFVASVAELAHKEKLCTQLIINQSINHLPSLFGAPGTEAFALENPVHICRRDSAISWKKHYCNYWL